jgi:hypothetical protein
VPSLGGVQLRLITIAERPAAANLAGMALSADGGKLAIALHNGTTTGHVAW